MSRAFEDVAAILGITRQTGVVLFFAAERTAWRTLEEVLWLAPSGKEPLPPLAIPELPPLVRKACEELAVLGMIGPAAASQPALVVKDVRENLGPLAAVATEAAAIPIARVFIIPDEVAAMHELFEHYRQAPRSAQDESPRNWEDLRKFVATEPTGIFGAVFIRPKHQAIVGDAASLATLRRTSRTGLATAAFHRKYGKFPERLEQLVPEFLPSLPIDPRDGQTLRIKPLADGGVVVYAPEDSAAVDSGTMRQPDNRWPPPIFRLKALAPP